MEQKATEKIQLMNKLCTISEENQDEEDKMNITLALDEILEIEKYSNYKARGVFGEQVLNAERLKKIEHVK